MAIKIKLNTAGVLMRLKLRAAIEHLTAENMNFAVIFCRFAVVPYACIDQATIEDAPLRG